VPPHDPLARGLALAGQPPGTGTGGGERPSSGHWPHSHKHQLILGRHRLDRLPTLRPAVLQYGDSVAIPDEITRVETPRYGDERSQVDAWLDFHRDTLLIKCAGLTAQQLKLRAAEPSQLTLLGLVRHMADAERYWFRRQFAAAPLTAIYWDDRSDFMAIDEADPDADFATYAAEVQAARMTTAGRSLDEKFTSTRGTTMDLRWVYLHMIEEYARHNGHADILRERIDGTTGV
jgi:uncharacterized damage-inducible protein DinB